MDKKPTLFTVLSPKLTDLYNLDGCIVVIIDVFRATSTIASALYNGAERVIPVAQVDACIEIGKELNAITAGERDGKIIEGLLHGNSPLEYSREFIENKTLVLTTTNGTQMLHLALERGADEIITGSFPNLNSVCAHLKLRRKNVILACSGWKNRFNMEDTLFAGAVIDNVKDFFEIHCDSSLMAQNLFKVQKKDLKTFAALTTHWHRLAKYGLENDMLYCLSENVADVLPFYDKTKQCLYSKTSID
ncbi:2-phosphosulfolactate phosphatase [Haoranjiania flava]|uniref:Probable 2-phosphosulfolactate phosphatase n=1 Tax=Haoranjiania flava TaxID=1856322 RepID=A0AAE3IJH9_9BACT|nr:2-phosphosulfolactate phosphatase [Haoranjiania flava]MCU7692928.1 2-phosphosulfolactate phosphatase [Haoranjiania flava]